MEYFEMDCACKGKNLDKMIQPAILNILYKESLHGFALIKKLGDSPMFHGVEPDRAGVYRYLKKMEESGLLASKWEMEDDNGKPKRVFSITEKGKGCLLNWMVALREYAIGIYGLIDDIENSLKSKEEKE